MHRPVSILEIFCAYMPDFSSLFVYNRLIGRYRITQVWVCMTIAIAIKTIAFIDGGVYYIYVQLII